MGFEVNVWLGDCCVSKGHRDKRICFVVVPK